MNSFKNIVFIQLFSCLSLSVFGLTGNAQNFTKSVNVENFDIAGLRLYQTKNEVINILNQKPGKIIKKFHTLCVEDEITQRLQNRFISVRDSKCLNSLIYSYVNPNNPNEVTKIEVYFVEGPPNNSKVYGIDFSQTYLSTAPKQQILQPVLSKYGSPTHNLPGASCYITERDSSYPAPTHPLYCYGKSMTVSLYMGNPDLSTRIRMGQSPRLQLKLWDRIYSKNKKQERVNYIRSNMNKPINPTF